MLTRGRFLHVIARSEATWQSASPAAAQSREQRLRRIRGSATDLPKVVPTGQVSMRGERIATPRRPKVRHAPHRPKASGGATLPWGSSPGKGKTKMKFFLILVSILLLLMMVFVVYCCLVMASITDRQMEKLESEHQQKDNMIQPK